MLFSRKIVIKIKVPCRDTEEEYLNSLGLEKTKTTKPT